MRRYSYSDSLTAGIIAESLRVAGYRASVSYEPHYAYGLDGAAVHTNAPVACIAGVLDAMMRDASSGTSEGR